MLSFHLTSTSETENAPLPGVHLSSTFSSLGAKLHSCHCRQEHLSANIGTSMAASCPTIFLYAEIPNQEEAWPEMKQ